MDTNLNCSSAATNEATNRPKLTSASAAPATTATGIRSGDISHENGSNDSKSKDLLHHEPFKKIQEPSNTTTNPITNENASVDENEDEYCVYTYKGGSNRSLADLPASFFEFDSLDCNNTSSNSQTHAALSSTACCNPNFCSTSAKMSANENNNCMNGHGPRGCENGEASGSYSNSNNIYSPDMDFLEMDFDPGVPGDDDDDEVAYTENQSNLNSVLYSCNNNVTPISPAVNDNEIVAIDTTDGSLPQFTQLSNVASTSGLDHLLKSPSKLISCQPSITNTSNEAQPHCSKILPASNVNIRSEHAVLETRLDRVTEPTLGGSQAPLSDGRIDNPSWSSAADNVLPSRSSPHLNLSMRLVKSNTLPKMGSHSNTTLASCCSSPPLASTPSSSRPGNTNFTPVLRSSGLSYSVPVMDTDHQNVQEHYKAVLLTSSKMPNQGPVDFDIGEIMIWTAEEAYAKSRSQIGVSACGATAVLNALTALGLTNVSQDCVKSSVGTRLRAEHADLPEYLISRSSAGATHEDLIRALHAASNEFVYAKFFTPHPGISKDAFCKWLLSWICKGAIPVVTRNLQAPPYDVPDVIPDAWHHQMVFGLSPRGVYLTNPIECTPVESLLSQITSASTLLIRREDVTIRMRPRTDLRKLARQSDPRWNELNVLGQVANMFLEQVPVFNETSIAKRTRTSHVTIPAAYKGGVVLCISRSSPYYQLLMDSSEEILLS